MTLLPLITPNFLNAGRKQSLLDSQIIHLVTQISFLSHPPTFFFFFIYLPFLTLSPPGKPCVSLSLTSTTHHSRVPEPEDCARWCYSVLTGTHCFLCDYISFNIGIICLDVCLTYQIIISWGQHFVPLIFSNFSF